MGTKRCFLYITTNNEAKIRKSYAWVRKKRGKLQIARGLILRTLSKSINLFVRLNYLLFLLSWIVICQVFGVRVFDKTHK